MRTHIHIYTVQGPHEHKKKRVKNKGGGGEKHGETKKHGGKKTYEVVTVGQKECIKYS
jgi:hypothetical protein